MTDKKHDFLGQMKKQYDELNYRWSRERDKFEAGLQHQSADVRKAYEEKKETYYKTRDDMKAKIDDLDAAGDSAWEDIKDGAQKSWQELSNAFDRATSHFKK